MRTVFTNAGQVNAPRGATTPVASGTLSVLANQSALVLLSLPMALTPDFNAALPGAGMTATVVITIGAQSWSVPLRRMTGTDPDTAIDAMFESFHWSRLVGGLNGSALAVSVALTMGADTQAVVLAGDCQLIADVQTAP